jgi:hypothetical protein
MVFDTFSKGGGKPSPRIRCFTPCLCYTYIDRLLLSVLSILYLFIDCFRLFEGSLELDSVLLIQMRVQDRTCSWLLGFLLDSLLPLSFGIVFLLRTVQTLVCFLDICLF